MFNQHNNELIKLQTVLFDTPEAEQAKIQMIKEELLLGRYRINSYQIANKLLEFSPIMEEVEMI